MKKDIALKILKGSAKSVVFAGDAVMAAVVVGGVITGLNHLGVEIDLDIFKTDEAFAQAPVVSENHRYADFGEQPSDEPTATLYDAQNFNQSQLMQVCMRDDLNLVVAGRSNSVVITNTRECLNAARLFPDVGQTASLGNGYSVTANENEAGYRTYTMRYRLDQNSYEMRNGDYNAMMLSYLLSRHNNQAGLPLNFILSKNYIESRFGTLNTSTQLNEKGQGRACGLNQFIPALGAESIVRYGQDHGYGDVRQSFLNAVSAKWETRDIMASDTFRVTWPSICRDAELNTVLSMRNAITGIGNLQKSMANGELQYRGKLTAPLGYMIHMGGQNGVRAYSNLLASNPNAIAVEALPGIMSTNPAVATNGRRNLTVAETRQQLERRHGFGKDTLPDLRNWTFTAYDMPREMTVAFNQMSEARVGKLTQQIDRRDSSRNLFIVQNFDLPNQQDGSNAAGTNSLAFRMAG